MSTVATHLSPALDAPLLRTLEEDPVSRPASLLGRPRRSWRRARGAGHELPGGPSAGERRRRRARRRLRPPPGAARAAQPRTTGRRLAPTQRGHPASELEAAGNETLLQGSLPSQLESTPATASAAEAALAAVAVLGIGAAAALTLHLVAHDLGHGEPAADAPRASASAEGMPRTRPRWSRRSCRLPPSPRPAGVGRAVSGGDHSRHGERRRGGARPTSSSGSRRRRRELEVWSEGKLVGRAPGPLRLRAGALTLTFKAPGYQGAGAGGPGRSGRRDHRIVEEGGVDREGAVRKGDLENPFQ